MRMFEALSRSRVHLLWRTSIEPAAWSEAVDPCKLAVVKLAVSPSPDRERGTFDASPAGQASQNCGFSTSPLREGGVRSRSPYRLD